MMTGSWLSLRIDFAEKKMLFAEGSKACLQRCEGQQNPRVLHHTAQVLAVDMDLTHDFLLTGFMGGLHGSVCLVRL